MFPVVISKSSSAVESSSSPSPASRDSDLSRDSQNFFLKDGRKINIGECALFKPPNESPPFIGIIRRLTTAEEGNFSLVVNWLYRPSDVKLAKGVSFEAAPNELFYSFHEDVIPAGSLLHPCKVAFLHKGAELPSGALSFVCRRVYDTENKCLWWLTDKDYINERQEEVDKLLKKTSSEMHGVVQSGGRSPKPLNGASSAPPIKATSDGNSLSSQAKVKKRERGEAVSEPSKKERLQKTEHGEFTQVRSDSNLKSELAKITEKGGLVDLTGVEKLVQLMQPENAEKRIDIPGRIMLADVISVTEVFDCLGWFVQLKGLSVLDDWLQEVHKKKLGEGKDGEKNIEDFLLALLRALDKLPVNLHALQTCNVGKSVNHLRTHKNAEISKKARILVDTWKKRVEAEMNMNDMKTAQTRGVAWPNKPATSDGSQAESRKPVDSGIRHAVTQSPAAKSSNMKGEVGDGFGKVPAAYSKVPAPATAQNVANQRVSTGVVTSEQPLTPIKEEKSSCSSQSQNNSQSCSGDQGKVATNSSKEDARSSNKSPSASRQRKSSNGVHVPAASASLKDITSGKNAAANRSLSSPTGGAQERASDLPAVEPGNSQRLIVRLQNSSVTSGKASGAKSETNDKKLRSGSDSLPVGNSHVKNGAGVDDEGSALSAGDELQKTADDAKCVETPKASRSMNALVESCVKISEAATSASLEDDGGMNLLASVATEEMVKSDNVSSSASPQRNSPLVDESCSVNDDNKASLVGCEESKEDLVTTTGTLVASESPRLEKDCEMVVEDEEEPSMADGHEKLAESSVVHHPDSAVKICDAQERCNSETGVGEDKPSTIQADSLDRNGADLVQSAPDELPMDAMTEAEHDMVNEMRNSVDDSKLVEEKAVREETITPCSASIPESEISPPVNLHVSDEHPSVSASNSGSNVKLDFDLNEGFPADDEHPRIAPFGASPPVNLPHSVTVAAAAKGAFVLPENPLRNKGELGWKGSAATSAFRPAEPRKGVDSETCGTARRLLDFDLNIADERLAEDVQSVTSSSRDRASGGLDLDLNKVEDTPEILPFPVSSASMFSRSPMPAAISNSASNSSRDFDLNNGPGLDETASDVASRSHTLKSNLPFPSSAATVRINGAEFANFTSWFPPTNSYSMIPGRSDHHYVGSQRILPPPTAGVEMYRGPVLPSSPAVPFPYSGFPFDTGFTPSTSNYTGASLYGDSSAGGALCFPTIPSQIVGPSGVVSSPYPRPFIMSIPGVSGTEIRKWGGAIDLNAGPGLSDDRGRQHISASPQGLSEEQIKAYQLAGVFKRKEPDGGWDSADRFSYKQASWQ